MVDTLTSFRLKIARAKEHLRVLKDSIDTVVDDPESYTITIEGNYKAGVYAFLFRPLRDFPMTEWGLVIGDCVHNARSALDHLYWALICIEHPESAPKASHTAKLPICVNSQYFVESKVSNFIGRPACAVIEKMQPYNAPDPKLDLLFLLHQYDITDKHRLIIPSVGLVRKGEVLVRHKKNTPASVKTNSFIQDSLHDCTVLATTVVDPPHSVMFVDINVSKLDIFLELSKGRLHPVVEFLSQAIEMVECVPDLFPAHFPSHSDSAH